MNRAIDADALLDGYKHMGYDPTDHPEDSYMEGWCKGFNAAVDHCMYHVIHAPTITPERKRGGWEDCGVNGWRCSNCRYEVARYNNTAFCPNCGFDMRYKNEEDDNV